MSNEFKEDVVKTGVKIAVGTATKELFSNPIVLFGTFILIVLAIIAFVFFVPAAYKIIAIIAVLVCTLVVLSAPKGKKISRMIVIMIMAVLIIAFFPQISFYASKAPLLASTMYAKIKTGGIGEGFSCISNIDKCVGAGAWQTKGTQKLGTTSIKFDWTNAVIQQSRAVVPLNVQTTVPLEITFTCFSESEDIGEPISIKFEKGSTEKSITCIGNIKNKLGIKMESDSENNLSSEIWISSGSSKGKLSKTAEGPYNLELSSADPQPFSIKTPVTIKLKKSSDFYLTSISSFDIAIKGSYSKITCPTMTGTKETLKEYFKDNIYSFICDLDISSVPSIPQKDFIEMSAKYHLETNDSTTLKIAQTK